MHLTFGKFCVIVQMLTPVLSAKLIKEIGLGLPKSERRKTMNRRNNRLPNCAKNLWNVDFSSSDNRYHNRPTPARGDRRLGNPFSRHNRCQSCDHPLVHKHPGNKLPVSVVLDHGIGHWPQPIIYMRRATGDRIAALLTNVEEVFWFMMFVFVVPGLVVLPLCGALF